MGKLNQVGRHAHLLFQGQGHEQIDIFVYLGMHCLATQLWNVLARSVLGALFRYAKPLHGTRITHIFDFMQLFDAPVLPVLL